MNDDRLFAPSAARNRQPILEVLRTVLPATGLVLELASGTGEHVVYFAAHLPQLTFRPSDPDAEARASILAWIASCGVSNVLPPLALDARSSPWPIARAEAVIGINMVHIAPWTATERLFARAAEILPAGAPIYLYGPYRRNGAHTSPGNVAFDASLQTQNPAWGVRDLEAIAECAASNGFEGPEVFEMPSNNLSLIFRRIAENFETLAPGSRQ